MKKTTLLFVLVLFIVSCGSKKNVERALTSGNYNKAMYDAIKKLRTNKSAKRKQDYILLLKDAYDKANERDLSAIEGLKTSNNPEYYQRIYETYVALDKRQEALKPLLPLAINGRTVAFNFNNYNNDIAVSRENVSDYFYERGIALLESDDKYTIREAYDVLDYIERINPNYEKTRELLQEAHERGIAHVIVSIENQTNQIIPRRLEDALLDFDTYGLDQFWSEYHAYANDSLEYDYAMQLQLARINISPEQVKEREVVRQRRIKDGWQYKLDDNGNVLKDSLGNDIKEDKFINVRARLFEVEQIKSAQIIANVVFSDIVNNEIIENFDIDSGFIFENFYARFRGDRRALNRDDRNLINSRAVPFPTSEQMIFDTGEDLKAKLKRIISDYKL
ncbi:hypothetical protein [Winogradskyella immobilis]|nr:hypothetical protein [Winogradskyella immobilis]MCG0015710.1 hypothetical protein [Winogradskyella immobilis]